MAMVNLLDSLRNSCPASIERQLRETKTEIELSLLRRQLASIKVSQNIIAPISTSRVPSIRITDRGTDDARAVYSKASSCCDRQGAVGELETLARS
jgi:hypothetical protein